MRYPIQNTFAHRSTKFFYKTSRKQKNSLFSKRTRVYRYGFNGKEKDDEIYGSGNAYDYGFRESDPRLGGRFWSVDPFFQKYVSISPYVFVANSPISGLFLNIVDCITRAV